MKILNQKSLKNMNQFFVNILLFSSILLYACDISKNKEVKPEDTFVKIYENNQFERSFTPLDIKQTSDGGYLILGEYTGSTFSSYPAVYLMKIQADGRFEWEYLAQDSYVTPISELLPTSDGNYEFFCSLQTDSLKPARMSAQQNPEILTRYPLNRALYVNSLGDGNYGFIAYPQRSQNVIIARGNAQGIQNSKSYYNQDNTFIEERLISHFNRTITPFPFVMGSRGGNNLFFTAFKLSNIAVMSDDITSSGTEPQGIINGGRQYDAAVSAMVLLQGNTFAMARYNADGENVFIPRAEVQPNRPYTNTDFRGNILPELSKSARVIIKRATIAQRNVLLYFTDTKNGQMVLFVYDEATGALIKTRYFGSSNTFKAGNFTLTTDGGLAIVGKTYVAGRFARICLFKLTAKEVEDLIK
jgi:hypothetical protein